MEKLLHDKVIFIPFYVIEKCVDYSLNLTEDWKFEKGPWSLTVLPISADSLSIILTLLFLKLLSIY